jgi:hypothetical protein
LHQSPCQNALIADRPTGWEGAKVKNPVYSNIFLKITLFMLKFNKINFFSGFYWRKNGNERNGSRRPGGQKQKEGFPQMPRAGLIVVFSDVVIN